MSDIVSYSKFGSAIDQTILSNLPQGPPGNGFKLTAQGNYDMQDKDLENIRDLKDVRTIYVDDIIDATYQNCSIDMNDDSDSIQFKTFNTGRVLISSGALTVPVNSIECNNYREYAFLSPLVINHGNSAETIDLNLASINKFQVTNTDINVNVNLDMNSNHIVNVDNIDGIGTNRVDLGTTGQIDFQTQVGSRLTLFDATAVLQTPLLLTDIRAASPLDDLRINNPQSGFDVVLQNQGVDKLSVKNTTTDITNNLRVEDIDSLTATTLNIGGTANTDLIISEVGYNNSIELNNVSNDIDFKTASTTRMFIGDNAVSIPAGIVECDNYNSYTAGTLSLAHTYGPVNISANTTMDITSTGDMTITSTGGDIIIDAVGGGEIFIENAVFDSSNIRADEIRERTPAASVTFVNDIKTNVVQERTGNTGCTIDGVLCKDGYVGLDDSGSAFRTLLKSLSNPALTADRSLIIDLSNADRTLDLQANVALDQNLLTTSSPTFLKALFNGTFNTSGAPRIQFNDPAVDSHPNLELLAVNTDGQYLTFDGYWNNSLQWISTNASSNYRLSKVGNTIAMYYNSGTAIGSPITWGTKRVWYGDSSGNFYLPQGVFLGTSSNVLNHYTEASQANTATGIYGTPVNITVITTRNGRMKQLFVNTTSGTATTATLLTFGTALTTDYRPTSDVNFIIPIFDNGVYASGRLTINTSGGVSVRPTADPTSVYSGTGTSGFSAFSVCYY